MFTLISQPMLWRGFEQMRSRLVLTPVLHLCQRELLDMDKGLNIIASVSAREKASVFTIMFNFEFYSHYSVFQKTKHLQFTNLQ